MICRCGHHAVYHDLKGTKDRVNPHVGTDWHAEPWQVDSEGSLLTDHCSGDLERACRCTHYEAVATRPAFRLVGRRRGNTRSA